MAAGSVVPANRQPACSTARGSGNPTFNPSGRQHLPCIAGACPACSDRSVTERFADAGGSPRRRPVGCPRRSGSSRRDGCRRALPGRPSQGSPSRTDKTKDIWQPMDTGCPLPMCRGVTCCPRSSRRSPTTAFCGIILPASHVDRSVTIERMRGKRPPLVIERRIVWGKFAGHLTRAWQLRRRRTSRALSKRPRSDGS